MNPTNLLTKTLFLWIIIGMGVLFHANDSVASSTKSINFDSVEPFKINAVISEINLKEAYLIVGEKKVFPIEFKLGNKYYKTAFVNQRGYTTYMTSMRPSLWVGERVLVKGFKLANGDIIAGIIKKISSGHR